MPGRSSAWAIKMITNSAATESVYRPIMMDSRNVEETDATDWHRSVQMNLSLVLIRANPSHLRHPCSFASLLHLQHHTPRMAVELRGVHALDVRQAHRVRP